MYLGLDCVCLCCAWTQIWCISFFPWCRQICSIACVCPWVNPLVPSLWSWKSCCSCSWARLRESECVGARASNACCPRGWSCSFTEMPSTTNHFAIRTHRHWEKSKKQRQHVMSLLRNILYGRQSFTFWLSKMRCTVWKPLPVWTINSSFPSEVGAAVQSVWIRRRLCYCGSYCMRIYCSGPLCSVGAFWRDLTYLLSVLLPVSYSGCVLCSCVAFNLLSWIVRKILSILCVVWLWKIKRLKQYWVD